jgi:drug/metabolite transporter (DMT)-like permease
MPSHRSRLDVALAALIFSTGGAAIKLSALSAWQIAGFRSGIAALVLWCLMPAWRGRPRAAELGVAVAYAATLVLYVTANTLTTAANSIFLQTTAPLWVLVAAPFVLGERNRRSDVAVVALIGGGLALFFVSAETPQATAPDPGLGNLLAAAAGACWAATLLGLRALSRDLAPGAPDPSGRAVIFGNAIAFAGCLPFAAPVAGGTVLDWGIVIYLGTIQIGLAYVFLIRGVRGLRAIEVSLLLVLEPVANGLFAWAVHGERPGPWPLAGCALILLGVIAQALLARTPADSAAQSRHAA